jgi:hypothetical protein
MNEITIDSDYQSRFILSDSRDDVRAMVWTTVHLGHNSMVRLDYGKPGDKCSIILRAMVTWCACNCLGVVGDCGQCRQRDDERDTHHGYSMVLT